MNRKNVLYLLIDEWSDHEFANVGEPINYYKDRYRNVIAGLTKEPVTSSGGIKAVPDVSLEEAKSLEYDTLVVIGANTWRTMESKEMEEFIISSAEAGKTVAAICSAASYLGTLGLLNNVNHTVNNLEELKSWAGDAYRNEEGYQMKQAVSDGSIITANGTASLEFGREVMLSLGDITDEEVYQWYGFFKNGMFSE